MDLLSRLKVSCESGTSPYDDVMSFNAMLNRRAVRNQPGEVLDFLNKGITAILEGCSNHANGSSNNSNNKKESASVDLNQIVLDSLTTLLKTWQNTAMPTFLSGCASDSTLPVALRDKLLNLLDSKQIPGNNGSAVVARSKFGSAVGQCRFSLCNKFDHESAARSMGDATVRAARGFAQVAGAESFLDEPHAFFSSSASSSSSSSSSASATSSASGETNSNNNNNNANQQQALSLALSGHSWLTDQLHKLGSQTSSDHEKEILWRKCASQALRLIAASILAGGGGGSGSGKKSSSIILDGDNSKKKIQDELSPSELARCLIHLAWRGFARAVPVSVLFRRLNSLGISAAHAEFLFLNGVGMLCDAPCTKARDAALMQLVAVYFHAKPKAPLSGDVALREDFEKFAKDALASS